MSVTLNQKVIKCPECNADMEIRLGRYGYFYGCTNFPKCSCVHCINQVTLQPLGMPGDKRTREIRVQAHRVFDLLWKKPYGIMNRSAAYLYLQKLMGLSSNDAHIGKFSYDQCEKMIQRIKSSGILGKNISYL